MLIANSSLDAAVVSFFAVRDGRIQREADYWPDAYATPARRAQWVESMEDEQRD
jgi:hypothetical protein